MKEFIELSSELKIEQLELIKSKNLEQILLKSQGSEIKSEDVIEKTQCMEIEFLKEANVVETIFFDEHEFEESEGCPMSEDVKEEYLNETQFETIKYKDQTIQTTVEMISSVPTSQKFEECLKKRIKGKDFTSNKCSMKSSTSSSKSSNAQYINLTQLRTQQENFKKRLQDAINSCKKFPCKSSVKKVNSRLNNIRMTSLFCGRVHVL